MRTGNLVYTSGQLPMVDGTLPRPARSAPRSAPEEAKALAQRCALNALAAVKSEIGDLAEVARVVKVVGFVATAPDFTGQPGVVNGASELLGAVFGEAGRHARCAVGVAVLPLDAPVEVELIVEVEPDRAAAAFTDQRRRGSPAQQEGERMSQQGGEYIAPAGSRLSAHVPEGWAEQIAAYERGEFTPVPPKHAATVVLLRDRADAPPDVYLLKRAASMAFAGGFYVFPGGRVDPRDADAEIAWVGPSAAEWARRFGSDEAEARALLCAAVRETFEESGVLLAGPDEHSVVADTTGEDWEADRRRLVARETSLAEFLASAAWCCAPTCSAAGRAGSPRSSSRGATTPRSSSPRCRPAS